MEKDTRTHTDRVNKSKREKERNGEWVVSSVTKTTKELSFSLSSSLICVNRQNVRGKIIYYKKLLAMWIIFNDSRHNTKIHFKYRIACIKLFANVHQNP